VNVKLILRLTTAAFSLTLCAFSGTLEAKSASDASVMRSGSDTVIVTWSGTDPMDVFVAEKPGLDLKKMRLLSDDDVDGKHEHRISASERPYFLLRSERSGETRRLAERVLPLENGSNFRDVGGYETIDGKRVKWGLIYRSGAMPQLTDRDYAYLGNLGIRVLCDLRSTEERDLAPTQSKELSPVRYVAIDYPASDIFKGLTPQGSASVNDSRDGKAEPRRNLYRAWPVSLAPQFKEIFTALLENQAPLAFNCSAGQDRTGVATALVLTALGVPRETILDDYHLSTVHRRPEFERGNADYERLADTNIVARFYVEADKRGPDALKPRPLYDEAGRARLLATFDEIETRWGSIERYLADVLDVDRTDLERLRSLYLE
jgi:protein-tyrosine phosphatase